MSSLNNDSIILTSEGIGTDATNVTQNLLPSKSQKKYLKAYNNFIAWKNEKGAKSLSEMVFLDYFQELANSKQPSTLWSTYSMLKSTVSTNDDIKIETYTKLTAYLKRQSEGYKSKKSKVFSIENVETFLNEAPDNEFLAIKVALIFGVNGACRGNELLKITVDDIEKHSDQLLLVKLTDTKTKIDRSFVIREDYKSIVEKYQALRPPDIQTNRFFIRYQNGKCFKQVIGKNKICNMPQEIASYLKLPDIDMYTGHCFRRTSSTLLAGSRADLCASRSIGGHKENSIETEAKISSCIVGNTRLEPSVTPSISQLSPCPSTSKQRKSPSHIVNISDPEIIPKTQVTNKTTTISIINNTMTVTFQNGANVSNINLRF